MKGAKGGILMLAEPKVGITYDQEFAKGVAEDKATVLSLNGVSLFLMALSRM